MPWVKTADQAKRIVDEAMADVLFEPPLCIKTDPDGYATVRVRADGTMRSTPGLTFGFPETLEHGDINLANENTKYPIPPAPCCRQAEKWPGEGWHSIGCRFRNKLYDHYESHADRNYGDESMVALQKRRGITPEPYRPLLPPIHEHPCDLENRICADEGRAVWGAGWRK